MITTPGPEFVKNNDQSGARSGDHTQLLAVAAEPVRQAVDAMPAEADIQWRKSELAPR
jgi:hypothetical protein